MWWDEITCTSRNGKCIDVMTELNVLKTAQNNNNTDDDDDDEAKKQHN